MGSSFLNVTHAFSYVLQSELYRLIGYLQNSDKHFCLSIQPLEPQYLLAA
jgi:hypothetical protein